MMDGPTAAPAFHINTLFPIRAQGIMMDVKALDIRKTDRLLRADLDPVTT